MEKVQHQRLLQEAIRIGDDLLAKAVSTPSGLYWKTVEVHGPAVAWEARESLYNGVTGIALFLLELYRQSQDGKYLQAATEALRWTENNNAAHPDPHYALLTGRMSAPFTWLTLYRITGDVQAREKALAMAHAATGFSHAPLHEYINGTSGTLLALLHLHAATKEAWLLAAIEAHVSNLVSHAHYGKQGLYWDRSSLNIHGLCGFSHGAAGIGFVFLELGHYFRNPAFYWVAEQAFLYERQFYSETYNNWLDLRQSMLQEKDEQQFRKAYTSGNADFFTQGKDMNAWCHGAAGIGLSRLRAYELWGKRRYLQEAQRAIEKTLHTDVVASYFPSFTLCHGSGGNAEIFLEAYRILHDERYLQYAEAVAQKALHTRERTGIYLSGTQYPGEDPGLFMGTAGVGYFYLRVLNPEQVPSILCPRLHPVADAPVDAKMYPAITLSVGALQRQLLASRYAHTTYLTDLWQPGVVDRQLALQPWDCPLHTSTYWPEFVRQQADGLPPARQRVLEDVLDMEQAKVQLDEDIASDVLLAYKQSMKAEDAERLLTLDRAGFYDRQLVLDNDLQIVTTRWHWGRPSNEGLSDQWQQSAGIHSVLLMPTLYGVHEKWLSPFMQAILETFQEVKTVREGLHVVIAQLEEIPPEKIREVIGLVEQQIREAIKAGMLIDPDQHPLKAYTLPIEGKMQAAEKNMS